MLAVPVDLRVAAVLGWANRVRVLLGLDVVDNLQPGERLNPWDCPLCRTIGLGAPATLQPEFSGTTLRVWRRDTSLLVMEAEAPPVVVAWSEELDRGGHDEYAVARGGDT